MLSPKATVIYRPELQLSIMFGSVALQQLGSVMMSETHVTNKGHSDALGLGGHLRPYWCLRIMLLLGPY